MAYTIFCTLFILGIIIISIRLVRMLIEVKTRAKHPMGLFLAVPGMIVMMVEIILAMLTTLEISWAKYAVHSPLYIVTFLLSTSLFFIGCGGLQAKSSRKATTSTSQ
ncbi:hypothetical protein KKD19_07005 [Patescibacteria group bacterium]|nr:hypothetical protein [Patescibacteria group bacterium]